MPSIRLNRTGHVLAAGLLASLLPAVARADIVLSSNDGHTVVDTKGTLIAPPKPMPDTVSIIDVRQYPPKIKDTIEVPGSVVGPPMAVWVAPDEAGDMVASAAGECPGPQRDFAG